MKQKLFFLMLTLFVLGAASVQAQVTIGADAPPHSAAVLDLQSTALGLKLPTVALDDVTVFQLLGAGDEEIETAVGLMVYNSSEETIGGSGKGIYVWEGKWVFTARSAPVDVPVTRITITSEDDVTVVNPSGDGLQLTATVEPANASNKTLRWTISYDPSLTAGYATIDQNGLITGVKPGNVTARASATDDFGAYRNFTFAVQPTGLAEKVTVRSETGITYVEVGKTLQLGVDIEPVAAYKGVSWSLDEGSSDFASISTAGLLTGTALGTATVIATPTEGSGVPGRIQVEIRSLELPTTIPVLMDGIEYQTYKFGNTTWMVENSQAGTWAYNKYDNDVQRLGMYYTFTNAPSACVGDWVLPSYEEASYLAFYMSTLATNGEKNLWFAENSLRGRSNNGVWGLWDSMGCWWLDVPTDDQGLVTAVRAAKSTQTITFGTYAPTTWHLQVRCVKHGS
jgi:uncharacterized protein YjdB